MNGRAWGTWIALSIHYENVYPTSNHREKNCLKLNLSGNKLHKIRLVFFFRIQAEPTFTWKSNSIRNPIEYNQVKRTAHWKLNKCCTWAVTEANDELQPTLRDHLPAIYIWFSSSVIPLISHFYKFYWIDSTQLILEFLGTNFIKSLSR